MKRLFELSYQDYMDMYPEKDHYLGTAEEVKAFIEHMNATWSGGRYSKEFKELSKEEAIAFAKSDRCIPDKSGWLIAQINECYA